MAASSGRAPTGQRLAVIPMGGPRTVPGPRQQPRREAAQSTQGRPFVALTAPPWGPLAGMTDGLALCGAARVPGAGMVALLPSRTSTVRAGTEAPAAAETPNIAAIELAFPAAPVP